MSLERCNHSQLVNHLADAWSTLSINRIEPYLLEDVEYDSHWVLETPGTK